MDADDYRRQNAAVGWTTEPPQLLEDVDGIPSGVVVSDVPLYCGVVVTEDELARVGLAPADVPNLTIHRPNKEH